jgi:hypothetical protein
MNPKIQQLCTDMDALLGKQDAHLGAATERLGVGDITRAQKEVSAAHALLGQISVALAAVAAEDAKPVTPPPVEPPAENTPGQPPMPMLPGQTPIEQLTTDDKLYLANVSGVGPKVYGTQDQINVIINQYNSNGGIYYEADWYPDRQNAYNGPLKL